MPLPVSSQHSRFSAIAALILFIPTATAAWNGQGETGLLMSRGNSQADTGNIKLAIAIQGEHWNHTAGAAVLYGRNNDTTSAERWEARWQADYKLNDNPFLFGAVRHEQDRFGGFSFQSTFSAGAGYQFLATERVQLSTSLGVGYRRLRPQQLIRDETNAVIGRVNRDQTSDTVANATLNYQHHLTDTTTIINKLVVEAGADNTFSQNDLSLQVAMTQKIALGLGYGIRHNSAPPAGLGRTDQLTTANVVYRIQ